MVVGLLVSVVLLSSSLALAGSDAPATLPSVCTEHVEVSLVSRAWAVVDGHLVWWGSRPDDDAAVAAAFWHCQSQIEPWIVRLPMLVFVGSYGHPAHMMFTARDPVQRTLHCRTAVPLSPSAQRFFQALGCVTPRG